MNNAILSISADQPSLIMGSNISQSANSTVLDPIGLLRKELMEDARDVRKSLSVKYDELLIDASRLRSNDFMQADEQNQAQLSAIIHVTDELNQRILRAENVCDRVRAMTCNSDSIPIRNDIAELQSFMEAFNDEFPAKPVGSVFPNNL